MGRRVQRGQDEFRRRHLGEVCLEEGFPGCRRGAEVVGCGRHGAEEGVEAEGGGCGRNGCWRGERNEVVVDRYGGFVWRQVLNRF